MIKMSYAHARSLAQNRELLMKLYQTQMPIKTAKRMKRILERVGMAAKYVEEQQYALMMAAAKEHAVLDEKGDPRVDSATGEMLLKDPDQKGEINKTIFMGMTPILKRELVLLVEPLSFDDTKLELTLSEIDLLGPLLVQEGEADADDLTDEQEPA